MPNAVECSPLTFKLTGLIKDLLFCIAGEASKFVLDPPQGNAIATIVNRNTVEPQPVIHHPVVRHVVQKLQQNVKNRIGIQQQPQLHQDMELPQAPAVLTSVGGVRQVRGGRGTGRGRGVGRGHQGAMTQQQVVALAPQQEVKMMPKMKVCTQNIIETTAFLAIL
jgi:hypothetical protein